MLGRGNVSLATDVVFALARPTVEASRDVVINVSGLLWEKNAHIDNETYQESVRELIAQMLQRGRSVTLLAHVLDNPSTDNDTVPIMELKAELGDKVQVVIPATLSEVREVLASARLVVGSRMHACLNALSVGTPSIPWAYSRKFGPLMTDIGWPHNIDLRSERDPVAATFRILDSMSERGLRDLTEKLQLSSDARVQVFIDALKTVRI
jgi:colanic acid/amylovoran biosynthesis protein